MLKTHPHFIHHENLSLKMADSKNRSLWFCGH